MRQSRNDILCGGKGIGLSDAGSSTRSRDLEIIDEQINPLREQVRRLETELHAAGTRDDFECGLFTAEPRNTFMRPLPARSAKLEKTPRMLAVNRNLSFLDFCDEVQ